MARCASGGTGARAGENEFRFKIWCAEPIDTNRRGLPSAEPRQVMRVGGELCDKDARRGRATGWPAPPGGLRGAVARCASGSFI